MSVFTLEEIYGVSRAEYCILTGVTPDELIRHLEAEVMMLERSYVEITTLYRESCLPVPKLTYFERLSRVIANKIESKTEKIKSLRRL